MVVTPTVAPAPVPTFRVAMVETPVTTILAAVVTPETRRSLSTTTLPPVSVVIPETISELVSTTPPIALVEIPDSLAYLTSRFALGSIQLGAAVP